MHKINPDPLFEKLSKHLFWDVDRSKLNFEKDAPMVVQRVLEYGMLEDWIIICDYYGVPRIAEVAMRLRTLEATALTFISTVAKVPLDQFRCYKLRPLNSQHWPY